MKTTAARKLPSWLTGPAPSSDGGVLVAAAVSVTEATLRPRIR